MDKNAPHCSHMRNFDSGLVARFSSSILLASACAAERSVLNCSILLMASMEASRSPASASRSVSSIRSRIKFEFRIMMAASSVSFANSAGS
jgi:hypothetical protein